MIHNSHIGSVKCKQSARELVVWLGIKKQYEDIVSKGSACLTYRNREPKEPMIIEKYLVYH